MYHSPFFPEVAKRRLSRVDGALVRVSMGRRTAEVKVTRERFEQCTQDLLDSALQRTKSFVEQFSQRNGVATWQAVSHLLLVGGGAYMPQVQEALAELTGLEPMRSAEPDQEIALGAAVFAGEQARSEEVKTCEEPTRYLDENVQVTVFRPKVVRPEEWRDLLAAAHLDEKRADAPEDEPEPIEQVRKIAERLVGEKQVREYKEVTQESTRAIPQDGELTFIPEMDQVEFNPPRATFLWQEDYHTVPFRMRTSAALDDKTARGRE